MTRDEEIIFLRNQKFTYAQIGDKFGLTKERVRQILKKHSKSGRFLNIYFPENDEKLKALYGKMWIFEIVEVLNIPVLTPLENHRKSNLKCKNIICPSCKLEFLQKRVSRIYCSRKCARQNPEELNKKKCKKLSIVKIPHGTPNGYTYHKCRCSLCTEAKSSYMKLYRSKK